MECPRKGIPQLKRTRFSNSQNWDTPSPEGFLDALRLHMKKSEQTLSKLYDQIIYPKS